MSYRNSQFQSPLFSQYRGILAFNFATTEEEAAAAAAKAAEEAQAAEAAKAAEEKAAADAAAQAANEEDPLKSANPFEEGSAQHDAFEKQREKFKLKLATETEAARKSAAAELSGKMDELLRKVGSAVQPKSIEPVTPAADTPKATPEDIQIVTDAMRAMGLDPVQIVQERRKQEVNSALAQLRKDYPNVQFDDLELVKFANDAGISRMGGSAHDILELAFIRKHKDDLAAGAKPPATPPATPPKKEPVPITNAGAKTPPGSSDKPKSLGDWTKRILSKYGGK